MEPAAAKQQIVERIKQASNILVTVSNNPSVDQLAACIGLTLLLNKMDKHATALFSGQVPSTIEFLEPSKTIETNTDSLQDFIISLDKDKADKLRYKVEDQVVRIFITPYKTSLSEKDLIFSKGDFNVEVVMALGVKDRSQLDQAITSHGRILHDATVVSVNASNDKAANLGQINWQEPTASSLSEMLVSISEAFGTGLIDNQIATAFLTGIVAETQRFSNAKTSPKVMTMSAQLMASGANQQLIVSKLEPPPQAGGRPVPKKPQPPMPAPAGEMKVKHSPPKAPATPEPDEDIEVSSGEIHIDEEGNIQSQTPTEQAEPAEPATPAIPAPPIDDGMPHIIKRSQSALDEVNAASSAKPAENGGVPGPHSFLDPSAHQPSLAVPFTADTEPEWSQAGAESVEPLSQAIKGSEKLFGQGHNIASGADAQASLPPKASDAKEPAQTAKSVPEPQPAPNPAEKQPAPLDAARSAVDNALASAPFNPDGHPVQALNSEVITDELHKETAKPKGPPPPVPPPLMSVSDGPVERPTQYL